MEHASCIQLHHIRLQSLHLLADAGSALEELSISQDLCTTDRNIHQLLTTQECKYRELVNDTNLPLASSVGHLVVS